MGDKTMLEMALKQRDRLRSERDALKTERAALKAALREIVVASEKGSASDAIQEMIGIAEDALGQAEG